MLWDLTTFFLKNREAPLRMRKRSRDPFLFMPEIQPLSGWVCNFYLNLQGEVDEISFVERMVY